MSELLLDVLAFIGVILFGIITYLDYRAKVNWYLYNSKILR